MRFSKTWKLLFLSLLMAACKSGTSGNTNSIPAPPVAGLANGSVLEARSGDNVMSLSINGSNCSAGSYPNKPCVSLTICDTGTQASSGNCTTVHDILVDTGSYGLRIFKSAIPARNLTQVMSHQGGALAECAKFGDGSSEWGSVKIASVILGNETAVDVPVQVLEPTYGAVPASCGKPDASAAAAGFNGILGVGLFKEDCGTGCTGSHTANGMYFTCTGDNTGVGTGAVSCIGGSTNSISEQVQNPVSALPVDNNGVIVELPAISSLGASSSEGYLILGIGTAANNNPNKEIVYPANPQYADFTTTFNGKAYGGFLDTGSNGLYFPQVAGLPTCSATSAWYCPGSLQTFSAVTRGDGSTASGTINFQVANASSLFSSGNHAFNDLGGSGGNIFDWGLPFYFGRNVYLGIDARSSGLGTGPYWAY